MEQLRLEAERKEKKKLRDAERKARLKAEGKLLTAKQKQDKARAEAMLEALRAQGVQLPEVGEKLPARLGTRVRPNKKKDQQQQNQLQEDAIENVVVSEKSDETIIEQSEQESQESKVEVVEKIKEAWDASSSEDESEEINKSSPESKQKSDDEDDEDNNDSNDSGTNDEDDDEDDNDEDSASESEDEHKTDAEVKREKAWERILVRNFL